MKDQAADSRLVSKLMFRLLPVQVLIAIVSVVNGIVSSLFASNAIGVNAMSVVGMYSPVSQLIGAIGFMLSGGATILCGRYIGRNRPDRVKNIFSLDLAFVLITGAVFAVVIFCLGVFDLTGFLTKDAAVRIELNRYLTGQAVGVIPTFLATQFSAFLSLENRIRRNTVASITYIIANVILNFAFVKQLKMGVFGLALASSLGLWIFVFVQGQYFISENTKLKLSLKGISFKDAGEIISIGFPGAATYGYQTIRAFIVNRLLEVFIGAAGISAFTACNTFLTFFWAVPTGMAAVARMMIGVSVGEEDRRTLTDVMRTALMKFVPLQCAISAAIIIFAVPLTRLYYRDIADPVYSMTVWGFRILPICMPLSTILMIFLCYGQASKKQLLLNLLALLDGVVCVAGFTALLIKPVGMNSVYIANVLNGTVTTIVIILYSVICNRRFPGNMEELMVIPKDFGVPEDDRIDITVTSEENVVSIAEKVQTFCEEKGIDRRRSNLAGLALEEMAGNVIAHGFNKDSKKHTVDVRVVYKDDGVILRLKDDCVNFDPAERYSVEDPDDIMKNIGIRMIYKMTEDVQYQNIFGLNVLSVKI